MIFVADALLFGANKCILATILVITDMAGYIFVRTVVNFGILLDCELAFHLLINFWILKF